MEKGGTPALQDELDLIIRLLLRGEQILQWFESW